LRRNLLLFLGSSLLLLLLMLLLLLLQLLLLLDLFLSFLSFFSFFSFFTFLYLAIASSHFFLAFSLCEPHFLVPMAPSLPTPRLRLEPTCSRNIRLENDNPHKLMTIHHKCITTDNSDACVPGVGPFRRTHTALIPELKGPQLYTSVS